MKQNQVNQNDQASKQDLKNKKVVKKQLKQQKDQVIQLEKEKKLFQNRKSNKLSNLRKKIYLKMLINLHKTLKEKLDKIQLLIQENEFNKEKSSMFQNELNLILLKEIYDIANKKINLNILIKTKYQNLEIETFDNLESIIQN